MLMTLAQAHALLPGSVLHGNGHVLLQRVHSDTRTLQPGDLFVALRGEHFDGHDHLAQAQVAGAAAVLAETGFTPGLAGLQVADSLRALQDLAAAWRQHLHLPLIAVAGSNGKTTVTQMIAAMLRAWHPAGALATAGNFNNHIGVPLTLLRLRQDDETWHRVAVLELGMNHPGEIATLARMAAPTVALVNNAQREHLEFMASVQAVARENGEAILALGAGGTVVIPADDEHSPLWLEMAGTRRVLRFADSAEPAVADITASAIWQAAQQVWHLQLHTPAGTASAVLHQPGRHNLRNALAATAAVLAVGAPLTAVVQGLADFEPVAGRSQLQRLLRSDGSPFTLVDDSYNANPDSVLAAIAVLAALPGPRWLVLGDMGEVGALGPAFHAEVGAAALAQDIEHIWSAGTLCAHLGVPASRGRHFDDVPALLQALPQAPHAAAVLVKGSRFMGMERVVRALQPLGAQQPGNTLSTGGNDAA